jgi:hypothetical protein
MDSREAREKLTLYRPGTTDAADPQMAVALEQVKRDPELAAWFEQHCAVYTAIRGKLKEIPIPQDLKRQIILDKARHPRIIRLPTAIKLLAAAAAVVILGMIAWQHFPRADETDFEHFRDRMASSVGRGYSGWDMKPGTLAQVRDYFRSNDLPTDYVLSKALLQLPSVGGAFNKFNDHPVEMLCLYDGVDAKGQTNGLWVFITKKSLVPGAPQPGKTEIVKASNLMTASWTDNDKLYMLAVDGDADSVKKYLQ